ncbi:MAG: (2Fe-2S) ferredoxin domain-containing protein [Methylophilus sp.]|nr:(2Fe-2S) ferredoxin domain-containing protein [Methylophilus sp.]
MKSILVCTNHRVNPNQPSCGAKGAQQLKQKLAEEVSKAGIAVGVKEIQCLGECDVGPNVRLIPGGQFFKQVDERHLKEILKAAKAFSKT